MSSFCRVSLVGNIGADPETRYTPNGAMNVRFNVAVNPFRRRNDPEEPKPTWYTITAWDRHAETLDRLVQQGTIGRGSLIYVEGKLEPRQYTGNDGQTRYSMDVTLSAWEFPGGGNREQQGQGGFDQGGQNRGGQQNRNFGNQADPFDEQGPSDMDDVPF